MPFENPLATSDSEQFVVGESDFDYFRNCPQRCESGAILFCRSGSAGMTINLYHNLVRRHTAILLLPGSIVTITDPTDDFKIDFCAYSREVFAEAGFRLAPSFFQFLSENPIFECDDNIMDAANRWLQMAVYTYTDRENIFRNTIIKNRLQNIFLELYDKIQRSKGCLVGEGNNRQLELFHRFISLIYEHCATEREVTFYADKLCISTRYLSAIVRSVAHTSAKGIIDGSVMMEIKQLLQSTDLSVQEIAYRLHFPDQSYFGRFVKKHTGSSPTAFRNKK